MRASTRWQSSIATSRSGWIPFCWASIGGPMQVREARQEDMPEVVAIYNEEIPTTTSTWTEKLQTLSERLAWFEARSARGFPTVVAEEGKKVVGVAGFGDFRDSVQKEGYRFTVEHSVHVMQSRWGRGV